MKSVAKKMVGLLIAVLLLGQTFALGEGVLGDAVSAVREGDTIRTTLNDA